VETLLSGLTEEVVLDNRNVVLTSSHIALDSGCTTSSKRA